MDEQNVSIRKEIEADISQSEVLQSAEDLESVLGIEPPVIDNKIYLRHRLWMMRSLSLAQIAATQGEVPVAAIIVDAHNQLVAYSTNRKEQNCDPTGHAEILALRAAGKQLGNWHLNDCTLYVTLEPCPMCAGAIVQARLGLLVYGADDPKAGAIRSVLNLPDGPCSNHRLTAIGGILEEPCQRQLRQWFKQKRSPKSQINQTV